MRLQYEPKSEDNLTILYLMIFFIIFTPNISIRSLPGIRLEQILAVILIISTLCKLSIGKTIYIYKSSFVKMYLLFSVFLVFSITVGSLKGVKSIFNDYFEIYKIIIYSGIFLIVSSVIKYDENKIKVLEYMNKCIFISAIIGITQYFNILGLNAKYVPLIAPTQYKSLVDNYLYPRIVGMMPNPNEYAVVAGIGILISLFLLYHTKKKKNYLFILVNFTALIMTLSRGGFLFALVSVIIYIFLYRKDIRSNSTKLYTVKERRKKVNTILLAIISIVIVTYSIWNFLPEEYIWRLKSGYNFQNDASWQIRLYNWRENIALFQSSPLFGIGPAKSISYEYVADNEWLLLLREYGVIGTFYLISSFVLPFILRKKNKDKNILFLYLAILAGSVLYMIPTAIYSSFRLMPLVMIIAGLCAKHDDYLKS